jgi:hypothetical protein
MIRRCLRLALPMAALVTFSACESSKSANPLSPTVAGPIPGVNITAPRPLQPNQGAQYKPDSQPITLVLENATTNGVRPLSYLFELSSDSSFATKLFTRDDVTPGANGNTSLRLPDKLASGRTYYWRARAQDGANTGPYSAAVEFTVLQPVSIDAPVLIAPTGGATVPTNPPQLRIRNASRSGPAGPVTYAVQVSSNDSFTAIVFSESAPEQPNETHVTPHAPLASSARFYWRARASDGTTTGPWSATASFVTSAPAPEPPPPPPPPPPGGGGGGGGGSCASNNGDQIVACISAKYPSYRRAGVSGGQRRSNMEFLRDRIIEAGLCGGLDLGWNLKRGGPDISVDFITERRGGTVIGHDIAIDYDNTGKELRLYWGGGTFPFYAKYTRSFSCH